MRKDSPLQVFKGLRAGKPTEALIPKGPRAPPFLCPAPTTLSIGPGRASQLWDLGRPRRTAVTLAHSGCILPLPHTLHPPSLGEFQHEILARESREFSLGPLEESLVPLISLFSPVHLPFPLKCSMKLTGSGSLLPCGGRVAQDDASMCGQTWVLFEPPFPCLENEFWIRRAPRPLPAPIG